MQSFLNMPNSRSSSIIVFAGSLKVHGQALAGGGELKSHRLYRRCRDERSSTRRWRSECGAHGTTTQDERQARRPMRGLEGRRQSKECRPSAAASGRCPFVSWGTAGWLVGRPTRRHFRLSSRRCVVVIVSRRLTCSPRTRFLVHSFAVRVVKLNIK